MDIHIMKHTKKLPDNYVPTTYDLTKSKRFTKMVDGLMKAYKAEMKEWHKHEMTGRETK